MVALVKSSLTTKKGLPYASPDKGGSDAMACQRAFQYRSSQPATVHLQRTSQGKRRDRPCSGFREPPGSVRITPAASTCPITQTLHSAPKAPHRLATGVFPLRLRPVLPMLMRGQSVPDAKKWYIAGVPGQKTIARSCMTAGFGVFPVFVTGPSAAGARTGHG